MVFCLVFRLSRGWLRTVGRRRTVRFGEESEKDSALRDRVLALEESERRAAAEAAEREMTMRVSAAEKEERLLAQIAALERQLPSLATAPPGRAPQPALEQRKTEDDQLH